MSYEEKIKELKIELPEAKAPVGSYVATKISGKLLYVSGQISMSSNGDLIKGKDWTINAIHTPGHTSNHMCFGLEENSFLFTGDHVMGWSTTVIIPSNL